MTIDHELESEDEGFKVQVVRLDDDVQLRIEIVGVDDESKITSIRLDDDQALWLANAIADLCDA